MQKIRTLQGDKIKRAVLQKIAEETPTEYNMWGIDIDKIEEWVNDDGKIVGRVDFRYCLMWDSRDMIAKWEEKEWRDLKKKDR